MDLTINQLSQHLQCQYHGTTYDFFFAKNPYGGGGCRIEVNDAFFENAALFEYREEYFPLVIESTVRKHQTKLLTQN